MAPGMWLLISTFQGLWEICKWWFGCKRWIYKLLENLYIQINKFIESFKFQVSMAQAAEIGSSNDTSNATRKWASHYLWSPREVPSHASHGHTSQVIIEITLNMFKVHVFLLSPLQFLYFKRFQSNIMPCMWWSSVMWCNMMQWNVLYPYHRERERERDQILAVTGMYMRYKDTSRVQFSDIWSAIHFIWLTTLQGREKDLLRRKAQRYCWRRLLRYIFQGFMQGRCLVVGSRSLCVENDDMHIVKSLLGPVGSGSLGLCLDYQFWPGVCRAQQCEANAQKILVLKVPCGCIAGKSRSQPFLGTSGWDHSFSIAG